MMITTRKNTRKEPSGFRGRGIKKAAAAALVFVLTAVLLPGGALAGENDIIAFKDDNLKAALLDLPGADADANKELTEGELAALTGRLEVINSGVEDISGMQFAAGLEALDLSGNEIRDISCLAPLVSSGTPLTELDVSGNYLDLAEGSDDLEAISALQSAGCDVIFEPQAAVAAEGITLDKTSLGMCVGDTVTLHAEVTPADAADKRVTWSSDNEAAASVTADGLVEAKAAGAVNITATANDGGFTAVCAVTVKDNKLSSSVYTIEGGCVLLGRSTVVDVFKSCFSNDFGDLRVYKASGKAYDKGIVGTGMKVKLYIGGAFRDEATVLIRGDANGDGLVDILDYTSTRFHILEFEKLTGAFLTSADADRNGDVDILDYTAIRFDILGFEPINGEKPLPVLPEVTDARIRKFLDTALAQIGKPYVYGSNGPDSFDCSGYVIYCLKAAGYKIGDHTANTLGTSKDFPWPTISKNELQPGDLMFYFSGDPKKPIGHVGIYLGNGYHIHASSDYHYIVICRINGWYADELSHGRRVFN